ncbi:hypothetical protein QYE76_050114 [Lolium multiflorum]|uniref:Uncharacterized protein n=1 Tax=Lolium multiflorum TaxID=4521 RepID=A0AAD8SQ79_LOLMU|nr:hypothetical protein QYE76_050114 [Lolium multiflorum]
MDMWQMLEKFHAEVVDSSSDEDSDQLMYTLTTTAASMIDEFNSNQGPVHRGSVKGRSKNLPRNKVEGQLRLHKDYFHLTDPVFKEKKVLASGQYSGHAEGRTVILEVVISQDLWISHSFFGMAVFINDNNVLHRSPVFNRLMQGKTPRVSYEVNGNEYGKPYYLVDGIYPDWATLVKIVRNPNSEKMRRFAKMQEAYMKDVERGFGVLQARWAIVRHPTIMWSLKTMHEVMTCCGIMHNMIVENERPDGRNKNHWEFQAADGSVLYCDPNSKKRLTSNERSEARRR